MTDSLQLHKEAAKLRQKMQDKLNDADRATLKAETFSRAGDFHHATIQGHIANNDYKDALVFEREAVEVDGKAVEIENRVYEIEMREDKVKDNDWSLLNRLEMAKDKLRGYY